MGCEDTAIRQAGKALSRRRQRREATVRWAAERSEERELPLPAARCLTKRQAAAYLGIGVTLLADIAPPPIKLGRRAVYDVVDLNRWLDEYKARGRAGKEFSWPVIPVSTGGKIRPSGGYRPPSRMAVEYARALGLETGKTRKRI
jgi:hypothetical protein